MSEYLSSHTNLPAPARLGGGCPSRSKRMGPSLSPIRQISPRANRRTDHLLVPSPPSLLPRHRQ